MPIVVPLYGRCKTRQGLKSFLALQGKRGKEEKEVNKEAATDLLKQQKTLSPRKSLLALDNWQRDLYGVTKPRYRYRLAMSYPI